MEADLSMTALWWAVIISGIYHGINPGMGWPLAVSAGLMERKRRAMYRAVGLLALGHFLAMLLILLPFSLLTSLVVYETEIRVIAGLIVVAVGIFLLIYRKHPRFLARVHPAKLALWSFLAAMAHGAGLMLLPIYFGMCDANDAGHDAAATLMGARLYSAFAVSLVHTAAMTLSGGLIAVAVYHWLGIKFISRSWFNLDIVWALSLVIVGGFGIYSALAGH